MASGNSERVRHDAVFPRQNSCSITSLREGCAPLYGYPVKQPKEFCLYLLPFMAQ